MQNASFNLNRKEIKVRHEDMKICLIKEWKRKFKKN